MLTEKRGLSEVFLDCCSRIKNPLDVKAFMTDFSKVYGEEGGERPVWGDLSLGSGYPGILILCTQLEQGGYLQEGVAHQYLLEIKKILESQGIQNYSLFSGLTGLCFAVEQASYENTRYQTFLRTLESLLLDKVQQAFLDPLERNLKDRAPSSSLLYDPISGICGIGRYALEKLSIPSFARLSEKITKILIQLTLPIMIKGRSVPGWYLPPTDFLNQVRFAKDHPHGNFNLGLAHGVTGILAYLAIVYQKGIYVEGLREAIERLSGWLKSKAVESQEGVFWPYAISWEAEVEGKEVEHKTTKAGWCYGLPGIARTLFLAGKALNDRALKTFAMQSFESLLAKSILEWRLHSPSLCHGIGGLLLITQAMSLEKEGNALEPKIFELKRTLMDRYDPASAWGFVDVDLVADKNSKYSLKKIQKIGLLEGATGVFLTLLSLKRTSWQLPFMIYA